MKISIIVPVYNTVKYLRKCLNSLCSQTYGELEIICVDDGSTDGSELIVDEFARKDARIIAIHKENGGESNARNTGLRISTGDYLGFMDCDDWIEPDMYETLINMMEKYGADLVASGWYCDNGDRSVKVENQLPVESGVFDRARLLQYVYKRDSYRGFAYMWNKLYRRSLFYDKHGKLILFDEGLRLGGDVLYLSELILNVKKAIYTDRAFYHYIQRQDSGCHSQNLAKREDWITAYCRIIQRFERENIDKKTIDYVKRFLAYHSSNVAEMAYKQRNAEVLKHCQNLMIEYQNEYEKLNLQYPERIQRYCNVLELRL